MTEPKLQYLGPISALVKGESIWRKRLARVPAAFGIVVILPTVVAAIYFLGIASPRYVSESRFIVRSASQQQPSSLGMALQGVGLTAAATDSFAVHEYVTSRDAVKELERRVDVRSIYTRDGIDAFSKIPNAWQTGTFENFYKGLRSYITVGYDSNTGISILRVEAFRAEDAEKVNAALLTGGEGLVNRLNARSSVDAVKEAERTVAEAEVRLSKAQTDLTSFRTREGFIDPATTAKASAELIGHLAVNLATARAQRAQLAAEAPNSPQLPSLDGGIRALEAQIASEQARLVGANDSLAPKISTYEDLAMEREFADKLLANATAALNSAQLESRRQKLYIERIVEPNIPDSAEEPKRWLSLLAVFASALLAYGVGWLLWAGVRESQVD